jgi:hypothetical protein
MICSEKIFDDVLKGLALSWQKNPDPDVFKSILIRIDLLMLKVVNTALCLCPHLTKEDPNAIYHAAMLGLYTGLKSVKEEENSDFITWRLTAYMKSSIRSTFPYKVLPENYIKSCVAQEVPEETVFKDLEYEFVVGVLSTLLKEDVLDSVDIKYIILKFVHGISYKDIAYSEGLSVGTIQKRVADALLRIRHQFRIRDMGAL